MADLPSGPRFSKIVTNGINLHVVEAGPVNGKLVFLLHGFPEFWYGWRYQIKELAEAGFHVVIPDQRGYNLSDKPLGVNAYDIDLLIADILGLANHFGQNAFDVIGHDWGALVGWWLAYRQGQRIRHLAILNAPHPVVWCKAIHHNPAQKKKSRYVQLFQIPFLPELVMRQHHFRILIKCFAGIKAFTDADLERYVEAWSKPGTLTAMTNWYRALLKKDLSEAESYRILVPTLILWSTDDAYAEFGLAEESVQLCENGRIVYFDKATHWVHHDEPQRVTALLQKFLEN